MKVLSWNILAQSYYWNNDMTMDERFSMILDATLRYDPDVVCFQEVDYFEAWWKHYLSKNGYDSRFIKRNAKDKNDGCMIAVKNATTTIQSTHEIFFDDAVPQKAPQEIKKRFITHNVGLIAVCSYNGKDVIVSNAHLYWNPYTIDCKMMQMIHYISTIQSLIGGKRRSCVITGDFNSNSQSKIVEYMRQHYTDVFYEEEKTKITTKTNDFQAWIDYIFTNLPVKKVYSLPSPESISEMPNKVMGSDHLPLISEFEMRSK